MSAVHQEIKPLDEIGISKRVAELSKLEIETPAEANAIQAIATGLLTIFCKGPVSTEKENPSHLTAISSFKAWDNKSSGLLQQIESHLNKICSTFSRSIQDSLIGVQYTVARALFLNIADKSKCWLLDLFKYMEKTYKSLTTHSGFTSAKAWLLVSQLVLQIFTELRSVRTGVFD